MVSVAILRSLASAVRASSVRRNSSLSGSNPPRLIKMLTRVAQRSAALGRGFLTQEDLGLPAGDRLDRLLDLDLGRPAPAQEVAAGSTPVTSHPAVSVRDWRLAGIPAAS